MATLIIARKSDGSLIGRCDARCYNAKGPKCTCICGGKNHGAGIHKAIDNTRTIFDRHISDNPDAQVIIKPVQLTLYDVGKK